MNAILSILSLLILTTSFIAKADQVQLISLTSESQPGKVSYLGVETNEKNQLTGIYFKTAEGKTLNFTMSKLSKPQVLCTKKGYNLVYARVSSSTAHTASLILKYVKNVLGDEVGTRMFFVKYNASLGAYELFDEKTHHISRAHVTTYRNFWGVAVGIDEIQTQ